MVIESSLPRLSEFHVGHGTIGIPQLHQEGVGTTPGTDSIEGSNSGGMGAKRLILKWKLAKMTDSCTKCGKFP